MQCETCGAELDAEGRCPGCGFKVQADTENHVRVLTPEEKNQYDGVTIEASGDTDRREHVEQDIRFERKSSGSGVYYRSFGGGSSLTRKLWIALIVIGILAFIFFVALPLAVIALIIGIAIWLFHSFIGI